MFKSGCTDDRVPRSVLGGKAEMIRCNADVPGIVSAEFRTEALPAAPGGERPLSFLPMTSGLPEGHEVLWGVIEAGALRGGIAQPG